MEFYCMSTFFKRHFKNGGSLRSVLAKMLDCSLEVSEFKLQHCYFVPFGQIPTG